MAARPAKGPPPPTPIRKAHFSRRPPRAEAILLKTEAESEKQPDQADGTPKEYRIGRSRCVERLSAATGSPRVPLQLNSSDDSARVTRLLSSGSSGVIKNPVSSSLDTSPPSVIHTASRRSSRSESTKAGQASYRSRLLELGHSESEVSLVDEMLSSRAQQVGRPKGR